MVQVPLVVCVLGCRAGSEALQRRARTASQTYLTRGATLALACGGRSWGRAEREGRQGVVEADDLARMMAAQGVPGGAIVRERCSLDTRDNARFGASLLRRRGLSRVLLVTCAWHLPRAEALFRSAGLEVEGVGVEPPHASLRQRLYWRARERLSLWHDERRKMSIV